MLNLYTLPKKGGSDCWLSGRCQGFGAKCLWQGLATMALASFCLWIKVSANPAFRFAKLWKSVEQLQHFDSKAYCFVMCGLGFPMIWLTIGRLLEITADTWKTTWTRMSWALHGRLVHMRTGSHDTWHRNGCSTTIVMYCKLYMCFFNICLCALTYCEDRL